MTTKCNHQNEDGQLNEKHICHLCKLTVCEFCGTKCEHCQEWACNWHFEKREHATNGQEKMCSPCSIEFDLWEAERAYCRAHGYRFN